MEDKSVEQNDPVEGTSEQANVVSAPKKPKISFKWVLLIIFILIIANMIRTQKKPEVEWQDYETGIKSAKELNKPLLISFYKKNTRMCVDMWADTYAHQDTIDFIERNFIPVMVDVDKQPDVSKEHEVGYYPTHFIKTPDNQTTIKTRRGHDPPSLFVNMLTESLEKMGKAPK